MQVIVNGKQISLNEVNSVTKLIGHLQLNGKIAIEINEQIVPRSQFDRYPVKDGDIIEVVQAIGGG